MYVFCLPCITSYIITSGGPSLNGMATKEFTPAERIRELNDINEEFSRLLEHAGQALKALSPSAGDEGDDLFARKTAFEDNTRKFYTDLQSATAKCKRQVYALEEAGIIAPEAPTPLSSAQQQPGQIPLGSRQGLGRDGSPVFSAQSNSQMYRITNGGLGNLDVGWLNSRGNKVGVEKEAELMEDAKQLLEDILDQ